MRNFFKNFKKRAKKPGFWVIFTTRIVIGVLVTVIANFIINHL